MEKARIEISDLLWIKCSFGASHPKADLDIFELNNLNNDNNKWHCLLNIHTIVEARGNVYEDGVGSRVEGGEGLLGIDQLGCCTLLKQSLTSLGHSSSTSLVVHIKWYAVSGSCLTLSLPSLKSTFSQPFKEKCTREVARIGSIISFHLSKAMKTQVLHSVWCNISGEAAGEIWHWSLLGVKGLMGFHHCLGRHSTRSCVPCRLVTQSQSGWTKLWCAHCLLPPADTTRHHSLMHFQRSCQTTSLLAIQLLWYVCTMLTVTMFTSNQENQEQGQYIFQVAHLLSKKWSYLSPFRAPNWKWSLVACTSICCNLIRPELVANLATAWKLLISSQTILVVWATVSVAWCCTQQEFG